MSEIPWPNASGNSSCVNVFLPGDSHILFARSPGFFPKKFYRGLDQVKLFSKLIKIYCVSLEKVDQNHMMVY